MSLTPWASIARIEVDGVHSGTGFLVAGKLVVTANHVVADKITGRPFGQIQLHFNTGAEFGDGGGIFKTEATIQKDLQSIEHDFAVLECTQGAPVGAKPLRLSDRVHPFDNCTCPGFAIEGPQGWTARGGVSSLNDPVPGGGTAIGVQLAFDTGVRLKGHSGAPLMVRDRVVGLLRTAFLDANDRTRGGIVHATAIQHLVDWCNRLNPGLLSYRVTVQWPKPATHSTPLLLADRKTEFEHFREMITGQGRKKVLLLQGATGLGKSTLMGELAAFGKSLGLPAVIADFKGGQPLRTIVDALELAPETILPATRLGNGLQQLPRMLEELAEIDKPMILMLDNWQDAGSDARQWVSHTVLPALPTIPPLILLILGQELRDVKEKSPTDLTHFCELKPILSTHDWHDYSKRKWPDTALPWDAVKAAALVGQGLPHLVDNHLDLIRNALIQERVLGGAL